MTTTVNTARPLVIPTNSGATVNGSLGGLTRPVESTAPTLQILRPPLVELAPSLGLVAADIGALSPVAQSYDVPGELADVVRPANEALSLAALNAGWNPLQAALGDFKTPSELFQGKTLVPMRKVFEQLLQSMGPQAAALSRVLIGEGNRAGALPETTVLRTPAHQFNIRGTPGNRVVFYGGRRDHVEINKVARALSKQGVRLIKQMCHLHDVGAQGGTLTDIVTDGDGGSKHCGGYSFSSIQALMAEQGTAPVSLDRAAATGSTVHDLIRSDWPSDYDPLGDRKENYNAHLLAVNYQGGCKQVVPLKTRLAWKQNADMWDCFLGMVVPFAKFDPDPRYRNYTYNPLDLYDRESAVSLANDAARLDWKAFQQQHGAFYCSEGQYVAINLGPQDFAQLKKSQFGGTKLGALIDAFQAAPGLTPDRPEIGWNHLLQKGLISPEFYKHLENSDRTHVYLTWIDEGSPGWQEFEPVEPNGLIATPMTVATLAWSLLHRYLPREGIARTFEQALTDVYASGRAEAQNAVTQLLGGHALNTEGGQQALKALCFQASMGLLLQMLGSADFKTRSLKSAGYEEITNDADKKKVSDAFDGFVATLAASRDQASLDQALMDADNRLRDLKVERLVRDDQGQPVGKKVGLMLYAAPASFAVWAQRPFIANSNVLQYVATAMHERQAAPV